MKKLKFDDFVRLQRGFDLPDSEIQNGKYPVVASTSIKAFHNEYKVNAPVVVTGRSGSLGMVQYINENCWPLNTSLYVKDYRGNLPKYVFYFLQTMHLEQYNAGAGVPTLNQNHLHHLKITVHEKELQNKVSSILSAYDELIEKNNRKIAILQEQAQELYKEWFVRFRFPGHERIPFKKSRLGAIPNSFSVIKASEAIDYYIGGGWGNDEKDDTYCKDAYVVRGTDFASFMNGQTSSIPYRFHKESNLKSRQLYPNDIIMEISGGTADQPVGRTALATKEKLDKFDSVVMCASFCKQIRCSDIISPVFYYYWLQFLYQNRALDRFQLQSTGISNFQFEFFLKKCDTLLPPKDVMILFENKVNSILHCIDTISSQNENLTRQRDLLLPRLMSGKLDVNVPLQAKVKPIKKSRITFEEFTANLKSAARAEQALTQSDLQNMYEAFCDDKQDEETD